jgi:Asp-tRNA(Asn)/Glu-tRNA(Gln) amidotransferase B subunit
MSLLSNLENFVNSVGNISDEKFLQSLHSFMELEKKPKAMIELKERIKSWKYYNYSDEDIHRLVNEFIHNHNNPPAFDPKTFLSKPFPDLEAFQSLSPENLKLCLDFDKKRWNYREQIVYNITNDAWNPELQRWLINAGFNATEWDLFEIFEMEDFNLLKFYFEKKVVQKITNCHLLPIIIEKNNMEFFRYLLDNDLISNDEAVCVKRIMFESAISQCIKCDNLQMMEMFYNKDKAYFKHIVLNVIYPNETCYNVMTKASKEMCVWLWGNDMKWTKKQAGYAQNKFMSAFFD